MKTLNFFLTVTFMSLSANLSAMVSPSDSIIINESYQDDLYMLKVDKEYLGGELVIYHHGGDVVMEMAIERRKVIIDFSEVKYGLYSIVLMKDGKEVKEFIYNKQLIISEVIR